MRHIKNFLHQWGIHSFLLPVFFVLHNYIQYYGLVSVKSAFLIFMVLELIITGFFLVTWLLTKKVIKSATIVTFISTVYLFFGDIKQFFSSMFVPFFSRYVVLLPLMIICILIGVIIILRKEKLLKFNLYLNCLLTLFICIDVIKIMLTTLPDALDKKSLLANHRDILPDTAFSVTQKPDIYFLVFDSYPNSLLLESHTIPPAPTLDSFLAINKFYLIRHSTCNYNNTPFSIDATLNMQYLQRLTTPRHVSAIDYNRATIDINRAPLFTFFKKEGYKIYNLSVFDIQNKPPLHRENFLTVVQEGLLLFNTLGNCIKRDILWNVSRFAERKLGNNVNIVKNEKMMNENKLYFNRLLLDSLPKIPQDSKVSPRFVYAHFYMPHYPYFYDRTGKKYDDTAIYNHDFIYNDQKFIGYVKYTNRKIVSLLQTLLKETSGKSVIVVQSDHGYRGFAFTDIRNHFKNLHAEYYPDQDYSCLHDSLSNVNTFRIILNKYFHLQMPLLVDSTIELKD